MRTVHIWLQKTKTRDGHGISDIQNGTSFHVLPFGLLIIVFQCTFAHGKPRLSLSITILLISIHLFPDKSIRNKDAYCIRHSPLFVILSSLVRAYCASMIMRTLRPRHIARRVPSLPFLFCVFQCT